VDWIRVAQSGDRWQALVSAVMKLNVAQEKRKSRLTQRLSTSEEDRYSMDLVKSSWKKYGIFFVE
jgi:hypothetical protein